MSGLRHRIHIVTPALASANNGNWQTAQRWARLLHRHDLHDHQAQAIAAGDRIGPQGHGSPWRVDIQRHWRPSDAGEVLMALHAVRSADSIQAWHRERGRRGLIVVLTGTDLYRDLTGVDPQARETCRASLQAADRIIVLQDQALSSLPHEWHHKVHVVLQSTTSRQTCPKPSSRLRAVMVGHLRSEKDPLTLMSAARLLDPAEGILIDHIGSALDEELAQAARQTQSACPHYRWLGGLTHEATRRRIQRAHLLVHASRMEGGAHVIMEAVCSGTPVLASRMDGNVGMLGVDYAGYFPVGDACALAQGLRQARRDGAWMQVLIEQCRMRAPLFAPQAEAQALRAVVAATLQP